MSHKKCKSLCYFLLYIVLGKLQSYPIRWTNEELLCRLLLRNFLCSNYNMSLYPMERLSKTWIPFLQLPSLALPMLLDASGFVAGGCAAVTMVRRLDRALQFVHSWYSFRISDFFPNFPSVSVFLSEAHLRFLVSPDIVVLNIVFSSLETTYLSIHRELS